MIRSTFVRASRLGRTCTAASAIRRASLLPIRKWNYPHPQLHAQRFYAESFTLGDEIPPEVTNLSFQTYHEQADTFLESLSDQLEALSQKYPESVPDVELTQGVMQLELGGIGSYVINKQPPNKQIWLASPVSGPNRFDFYKNEWISLRDGSKLLDILNEEINQAVTEENVTLTPSD
ncbi:hypothetical protein ZYGR_0A01090 [Zygosaccharomyces rouxii]|uniref:ferroxidase n=2 Tax=Zygosaccharomyces rouxii TaxID=4956 RepID=C5DPD4_ZYGRC|nr:uncharacterized protein ZYRO0A02464g [Zygosaccharomyces rouxii]KAH9198935.1 hypothetical protein LQ764DRAFT_190257 [Zygosaccharomyces rouxii]GAV46517.1 hypothetical protein ZYGR_0A01090 [Zygosaccharomyces rouxii]CAR25545.1 ZYRO0A02464p [Zygosaccharomyces rouxii]